MARELVKDRLLELVQGNLCRAPCAKTMAFGCRIFEKPAQQAHAQLGIVRSHILVTEGGHHGHPSSGARDGDVEASFAAVVEQWTEPIEEIAGLVLSVPDRQNDRVTLVALYPFKILDEEAFGELTVE